MVCHNQPTLEEKKDKTLHAQNEHTNAREAQRAGPDIIKKSSSAQLSINFLSAHKC